MLTLAIDSSTLMSSCAVLDETRVIGEYSLNQDMSHSEKLIPMIKGILEELDMDIKDIDLFAVSTGPGSFTGLRIGLATMKAFAHVNKKPIVGVSTLEALAYNVGYGQLVVPIIDARRDRVYRGIYSWEKEGLRTIKEPDVLYIDDLIEELDQYSEFVVAGNGLDEYGPRLKEALGEKLLEAKLGDRYPRGLSVGQLALEKYRDGQEDSYYSLVPNYLRMSQAERERKCR